MSVRGGIVTSSMLSAPSVWSAPMPQRKAVSYSWSVLAWSGRTTFAFMGPDSRPMQEPSVSWDGYE